jgi:hypothetical protein
MPYPILWSLWKLVPGIFPYVFQFLGTIQVVAWYLHLGAEKAENSAVVVWVSVFV